MFESASTTLGASVTSLTEAHPGHSGVFALPDPWEAFAARVLLADAAEFSLDVQYYLWHNDLSGTLLFGALRRAADRGVKVRLLLDDNNTGGLDAVLSELSTHPNIEVRLFNPFRFRRFRLLGYLTDFSRLNRRMHNKSFTADGRATIIGGRNIGDEYFGAGNGVLFVDLDVLAIGPVVADVARDFDRYWTSESAQPALHVLPRVDGNTSTEVSYEAWHREHDVETLAYVNAVARSSCIVDLLTGELPLEWAATTIVSDHPAKGLGRAPDDEYLWARLKRVLNAPTRELYLISPYFVPTAAGVRFFASLAKAGVAISVLTNSLEATDVAAVHAGYAKRRKALLRAGITLYEIKRAAAPASPRDRMPYGSSSSSLHAKTFSVDGARVFIGSFNFDPRSERLNTEIGFVIDSPAMARVMAETFASRIPENSYRVRLGAADTLEWIEQRDAGFIVHTREPGASVWRRLAVAMLSLLPIEWLL